MVPAGIPIILEGMIGVDAIGEEIRFARLALPAPVGAGTGEGDSTAAVGHADVFLVGRF